MLFLGLTFLHYRHVLDPPCATNGLRFVSKAVLISSSGRLIPSATGTSTTFFPSKRSVSTWTSAATIIPVARSISCSVKWF